MICLHKFSTTTQGNAPFRNVFTKPETVGIFWYPVAIFKDVHKKYRPFGKKSRKDGTHKPFYKPLLTTYFIISSSLKTFNSLSTAVLTCSFV